jgi:hypothetical protein
MSSLNPYMRVDNVKAVLTRRTARRDYPVKAIPMSRTQPAFGLSSHPDSELLIGQPSDSRRADPFSEQLAQSMKRLSATLIPPSRILPLLCAPNGRSLIDMGDTAPSARVT